MKIPSRDQSRARTAALAVTAFAALSIAGATVAYGADAAAVAEPAPPSPAVLAFDRFMVASSPVCSFEPSKRCVDMGWRFADADRDGTLSLAEIKSVRAALQDWMAWKGDAIPRKGRTGVTLGLIVFDMIGAEKLFATLNTSHTGRLTKAELLADVRLDERPLGAVLQDPKSVDREDLAKKLGGAAPVVNGMIDESKPDAAPQ